MKNFVQGLRGMSLALGVTLAAGAGHAGQSDIVDTAVGAGSFNTLAAALQAAGLVDTLKGHGPFTVFAPTDAAFAALPDGTVEMLLKPENRDQLVAVLTYHVVADEVTSDELVGQTVSARTVNGAKLIIDGRKGVMVNDATVDQADIMASNGVIHVVDKVILPEG
ncbi:Uncaracterized surface protein containing fasciclin (FAS1) repeats [Aliiruegeria lutimaris]|uniref:Uncaracterized surface protein containing fasciclin (FAS1) repeats n=2 Tax=Aliiruegeria lutimaris TaxID=571298 RepID=A0A1G9EZP8_9RHOB|nr:Uncaracterized surface protein containing fasciclin (FAS1) repeats [Aliiruegeria lutimaris]